jgi:quinol monooxygenase YgiN
MRHPHRAPCHEPDHAALSRRKFIAVGSSGGLVLAAQPVLAQSKDGVRSMEIKISTNTTMATLVNVFSVEPDRQKALRDLLIEGTEGFFAKQPGFVSASIHNSKDGSHILNYSQWRSPADIEAYRNHPDFGAYIKRIVALTKSQATFLCDVSYVHTL